MALAGAPSLRCNVRDRDPAGKVYGHQAQHDLDLTERACRGTLPCMVDRRRQRTVPIPLKLLRRGRYREPQGLFEFGILMKPIAWNAHRASS